MKYKLLLALCGLLFVVACKKNNNPAPSPDANTVIKEQAIGSWKLVDAKTTYYDKSGKESKSVVTVATADQSWVFRVNNVVNSYDSRGERSYQYSIDPVNGRQQLTLTGYNDNLIFDLVIESNLMSWTQERNIDDDPAYSKIAVIYHLQKM